MEEVFDTNQNHVWYDIKYFIQKIIKRTLITITIINTKKYATDIVNKPDFCDT